MKSFFNFWKPFLIAIFIFYGSLTSGEKINTIQFINFKYSDKIIHFFFYSFLSLTFISSLYKNELYSKKNKIIITFCIVVSYGILIEFLQHYLTISRSGEIFDALSNSFGCITGIIIYSNISKYNISKIL